MPKQKPKPPPSQPSPQPDPLDREPPRGRRIGTFRPGRACMAKRHRQSRSRCPIGLGMMTARRSGRDQAGPVGHLKGRVAVAARSGRWLGELVVVGFRQSSSSTDRLRSVGLVATTRKPTREIKLRDTIQPAQCHAAARRVLSTGRPQGCPPAPANPACKLHKSTTAARVGPVRILPDDPSLHRADSSLSGTGWHRARLV
jgi:hypothetical protein